MAVNGMSRRRLMQGAAASLLASAASLAFAEKKRSAAFERFRFSFFEDKDSAREGVDTDALLALEGVERRLAEDMLIRFLPDARGIVGLGELRSRRAAPKLQRLFDAERRAQVAARGSADSDWLPYRLVYVAKALWQIQPEAQLLAAVVEVLGSADIEMPRMNAALALEAFRDPAAVSALTKALDDEGKFVRHHAARSLLFIHGRTDETDVMKNGSDHMTYRLMSDDPERHASGKRDLLAAIAGRAIATQP